MATVTLTNNETGESYEFPILEPTIGPNVIDVRKLYAQTGMFTYDPGFTSTANCSSDITYIDGGQGLLLYRGYEISELANNKSYLDVCFLLLNGEIPTEEESNAFDWEIRKRAYVNEGMLNLFNAMPDGSHPMAILSASVAALSAFYSEHVLMKTDKDKQVMARRIIAKIPTLAALSYRNSKGIPIVYPDLKRSYTENFLYMMRAYPDGYLDTPIKAIEVEALDTIFTLHADHEQNASTTTVRTVASTGAHPYAAVSAGIDALWGAAHGGANEASMRMLEEIGSVDRIDEYIKRVKDPEDSFKLMGFGHRVYKNYDPRAKILKTFLDKLKGEVDVDSHLLEIAEKIEDIALNDEYFISRKLYPNIDFYSGLILTALKIPRNMFTTIFVIGRSVGWITQWMELNADPEKKIARPRQLYKGPAQRSL